MPQQPLTNDELKQFMADPDTKAEDVALLTPDEKARFDRLQSAGTMRGMARDVVTGAGKGAADTAVSLGSMVHSIPGVGDLTDMFAKMAAPLMGGDALTDPKAAFNKPEATKTQLGLDAENTAQSVGKTGEQIGEFFIPAPSSRLEAVKSLVRLIPDSASPRAMALGNKIARYAGRILGEAGSAAGVSAVHGDDNPEISGAIAGGTSAAAEGLGPMVKMLLGTKLGREIAPMLIAVGAMHAAGGITSDLGVGAGLGSYGVLRGTAKQALRNPKVQAQTGRAITQALTKGGELAAGSESEARVPKRRKLNEALRP